MTSFPKRPSFESATYRAWVRAQECISCDAPPPSEFHHWPTRGSSGGVYDLRAMPLCRSCHIRAGGQTDVRDGRRLPPLRKTDQHHWTAAVLQRFVETAPPPALEQVMREIARWRAAERSVVPY